VGPDPNSKFKITQGYSQKNFEWGFIWFFRNLIKVFRLDGICPPILPLEMACPSQKISKMIGQYWCIYKWSTWVNSWVSSKHSDNPDSFRHNNIFLYIISKKWKLPTQNIIYKFVSQTITQFVTEMRERAATVAIINSIEKNVQWSQAN